MIHDNRVQSIKQKYLHYAVVIFVSTLLALYLHWPAFQESTRLNEDWRQSPHWLPLENQSFQDDDPIIAYARSNTTPLENIIYRTESYFGDVILFGKINAIFYFVLTALVIFAVGLSIGSSFSAWCAVVTFLFFPSVFRYFSGGFSHCWMFMFSAITVWIINRQAWKFLIPLMVIESLGYPPAAVLTTVVVLVDAGCTDFKKNLENHNLKRKYLFVILSFGITLTVLGLRYILPSSDFGHLVSGPEIHNQIEFTEMGRYKLIPVPLIHTELYKYFVNPFFVIFAIFSLILLRLAFFRLPRGLYALLAGSVVVYLLASLFLLKLYIPARYIRYVMPIFILLTCAYWFDSIRICLNNNKRLFCFAFFMVIIGLYTFSNRLDQGLGTNQFEKKQKLYEFVRNLPGRPLIAAPPYLGSDLPLFCGKSVLVSYELAHPWWTEYWRIISERTKDFYLAYYTQDPETVEAVIKKYGINYWIVDRNHFEEEYIEKGRYYFEPFNSWISEELEPSLTSFVRDIPVDHYLFDDGRYFIVSFDYLLK